jgi:hypothetical protein
MNYINNIFIQELCQALEQPVELGQHLLANPYFMTTTMVVDCEYFRPQRN